VLSGIIFVNRNGLRWRDAPPVYGPHKTLYNRWKRWSEAGVFLRMMEGLSAARAERRTVMIDATYLKAHRTASSLRVKKGGLGRLIGRTKGGMNTKLHAVTDANGRPISLFMTAGQVSDYTGAAALLDSLPKGQWLLGDREALQAKGITPCIPGRKSRIEPVKYDKRQYKAATGSRSCSVGSRTGGASPHGMTDAQPSSSPQSPSPLPCSSGYES
jgi:transposase